MENFGKIKNAYNELFLDWIEKKDESSKKIFKQYLKTIKESKILKAQFLVFNNLENKVDADYMSANLYVNENIKLLQKFKISDILNENKKLIGVSDKITIVNDYHLSNLHESIHKLITTKRQPNTIDVITENTKKVIGYITDNKEKEIIESVELPNSMLVEMMVNKFNETYEHLDENDKSVLKSLLDSDDNKMKEVNVKLIDECLILINEKLKSSDIETKEKLLLVKEKLLGNKESVSEEKLIESISKLLELKDGLK